MLRRTIAVATLAFASACARGPVRPVTVHLDPGEGTFFVTDRDTGEEWECATECEGTLPTRTRLDLILGWPRPEGDDYATHSVTVMSDLSIRGEWNDRSGFRVLGGLLMFFVGGGGAGLAGYGGSVLEAARRRDDGLSGLGGGLLITLGAVIGVAGIGVGSVLVGLRDHARIRVGPFSDATVMLTPTDGGAMFTLGGGF